MFVSSSTIIPIEKISELKIECSCEENKLEKTSDSFILITFITNFSENTNINLYQFEDAIYKYTYIKKFYKPPIS